MSEAEIEEAEVVCALAQAGVVVESVYDLVNTNAGYSSAIPTLLDCLDKVRDLSVKEGIVRALSVKEARPQAAGPLVSAFRDCSPQDVMLKWSIGSALSVVANETVFDDIVELVTDRHHGKAREMLAVSLGNMTQKQKEAVRVLVDLLQDEEVAGHAIMALGKLRARAARSSIERFVNHPKAWVRKEAKKALARIYEAK